MNDTLYSAISLYGDASTHEQADAVVDQIKERAEVSHRQAEELAVICVQNHIALSNCASASYIAVNTDRLKKRGVIP